MLAAHIPPPAMIQPAQEQRHALSRLLAQTGQGLMVDGTLLERAAAAKAAAERKDILAWGAIVMPEKFFLPFCTELHGYFERIRHEKLTSTEAPRGHSKTTVKANLIPLFQALEEPEKYDHYLNVQATAPKAIAVNVAMKAEIEDNELLSYIYGEQVSSGKWTDQQFVLKNGVVFSAIGAGQSIRGIQYRNRRPSYIIVDDLYDEDDIESPDAVAKKNRWFWGSLYPTRAKGRGASFHVQGTAISGEDVLAELSKQDGVIYKQFSAIKQDGSVLWPELNTRESLEEDRIRMGSVIFGREMQNERRDDASSIIKAAWLEKWEYDPDQLKFDDHFKLVGRWLGCDPSIGATKDADLTGMAYVLETRYADAKDSEWWVDGLWNERISMNSRILKLNEIWELHGEETPRPRAKIEGIAGFKDFVAEVKRRTSWPVHEISSVKDKRTNLVNKSMSFEQGRIHLSKRISATLRSALVHQLVNNTPHHDDLRDALLLVLPSAQRRGSPWRPIA